MADITKDMVANRHLKISNTNGPRGKGEALANQAFRFLRTLFNYAIVKYETKDGKQLLPNNPVIALTQRRQWNKNRKRRDVIFPKELAKWYEAVQGLKHQQAKDILILCLLTGLRRTEAMTLRWEYVNLQAQVMSLPSEVVKTNEPHCLPLSDYLLEMFERMSKLPQPAGNPYVFISEDLTTHIKEPKSAVASVVKRSGVKFSMHTLRRTFETVAESLKVPTFALKKLLNHKVSDITADYIQITVDRLREPMQEITTYFVWQFQPEDLSCIG